MNQKSNRKRVFVSRDIQGTILVRLTRYWVFYHLGLWGVLLAVEFFQHLVNSLFLGETFDPSAFMGAFFFNNRFILIAPVMLFPAVVWDMLRITHKIAGPLVRFRSALLKLSKGEPVEKIRLRDGDLLTEFQDSFNQYIESLAMRTPTGSERDAAPPKETAILEECHQLNSEVRGTIQRDFEHSSTNVGELAQEAGNPA